MQLWPILIQFHKFQPVPVALYGGYLKPNMNEFLREFIAEIKTLISSPAQILNKQYNISIFCLTCDAPARSLLKGIIQHTGYYACERCTIKGRSSSNRIVYNSEETNVTFRTNDQFRLNQYSLKDLQGKCHQTSVSMFCETDIDMIKDFALNFMHLVCLGVTRRLLYYFKGTFKGISVGRLSSVQLNQISNSLTALYGKLPSEFARQPRSLAELDRWKATELRNFLLYTGPVVLKGIIDVNQYKHFLSLSVAIRLLCEEDKDKRSFYLNFAKDLLNYFVQKCKEHYGNTFCVYNVHGLLHITDDVEYFGLPLDEISAFQFENYLQKLKHLVRSIKIAVCQLTKRLSEIDFIDIKSEANTKVTIKPKDNCFLLKIGIVFIHNIHSDGTYDCSSYSKDVLEGFFNIFLDSKELNIFYIKRNIRPVKCTKKVTDLL